MHRRITILIDLIRKKIPILMVAFLANKEYSTRLLIVIKHSFCSNVFEFLLKMAKIALQLFHFVHKVKWRF